MVGQHTDHISPWAHAGFWNRKSEPTVPKVWIGSMKRRVKSLSFCTGTVAGISKLLNVSSSHGVGREADQLA
ncbi:hypothetical protein SHIRM173S_08428 [Streptomyces hirsutus]